VVADGFGERCQSLGTIFSGCGGCRRPQLRLPTTRPAGHAGDDWLDTHGCIAAFYARLQCWVGPAPRVAEDWCLSGQTRCMSLLY